MLKKIIILIAFNFWMTLYNGNVCSIDNVLALSNVENFAGVKIL